MTYKIHNHTPKEQVGAPSVYPFHDLQPGQSFFVPMVGQQTADHVQCNVHSAAKIYFGESGRIKTQSDIHDGQHGVWVWIKANSPLTFRTSRKPKPATRCVEVHPMSPTSTSSTEFHGRWASPVTMARAPWDDDSIRKVEAKF